MENHLYWETSEGPPGAYRDLVGELGPDPRHLLPPRGCGEKKTKIKTPSGPEELVFSLPSVSPETGTLPKLFLCLKGLFCGWLLSNGGMVCVCVRERERE